MCDGGITAIGEQSHSPGAGTPEDELNTLTSFPTITMPPPAAEGPPDGATGSASGESEVEVAVTSSDAVAAVAVAAAAGSPSAAGVDPTGAT
jgi:hypothetical protein